MSSFNYRTNQFAYYWDEIFSQTVFIRLLLALSLEAFLYVCVCFSCFFSWLSRNYATTISFCLLVLLYFCVYICRTNRTLYYQLVTLNDIAAVVSVISKSLDRFTYLKVPVVLSIESSRWTLFFRGNWGWRWNDCLIKCCRWSNCRTG